MVRWYLNKLVNSSNRVEYLKELNKKEEDGILAQLPKKEAALLRREQDKLDSKLRWFNKDVTSS